MISASVTLGLLLSLFINAQLATAVPIPSAMQTVSQPAATSTTSSQSLIFLSSSTTSTYPSVTQNVAQQQSQTGNNYALEPFGILGSPEGQGNAGSDDHQPKQTSKAVETNPGASTTKQASNTGTSTASSNHGSATKTESLTGARSEAGATPGFFTQPVTSTSATITNSAFPDATPSQTYDGSGGDPSSASSMNAWKIIGIGVLAFVGVALLVLGTAFQDTIIRALCRPFRRRKEDEEVFVPDWRRGSWQFGEDGVSIEKPSFREAEDEEPRIRENEKGRLAFPLPPISPFPLRRTPSTTPHPVAEPGIAGVGIGSAAGAKSQSDNYSNYSILPSPPGLYTSQVSRKNAKRASTPPTSPKEHSESDAYGGME